MGLHVGEKGEKEKIRGKSSPREEKRFSISFLGANEMKVLPICKNDWERKGKEIEMNCHKFKIDLAVEI
jgi:hypothetical protein